MKPDFSETTYGYAVTREVEGFCLAEGHPIITAPRFPTLAEEKSLGYDVALTTKSMAFFMQFKRGEYISVSRPGSPTWPHASGPHYRIEFPANHHQLPVLQTLETDLQAAGTPAIVCYIAPAFWKRVDFDKHFAAGSIVRNSYGCQPSAVPADNLRHHLVVPNPGRPFVISDPVEVPDLDLFNEIGQLFINDQLPNEPLFGDQVPVRIEEVMGRLVDVAADNGINTDRVRQEAGFNESSRATATARYAVNLAAELGINIAFTDATLAMR